MVYLTLFYDHGGSFVTKDNGTVVYEVDNVDVQDRLDEDTLDVFAMRNHHHNLGYPKIDNCRWLEPGNPIETGLRSIVHDVDLMEMVPTQMKQTSTKTGKRVKVVIAKTPPKSKSPSKHKAKSGSNPLPKPTHGVHIPTCSKPTSIPTPENQTYSKPKPNQPPKVQSCSKPKNAPPKSGTKSKSIAPPKNSTKATMVPTKQQIRKSTRVGGKSMKSAHNESVISSDSYDSGEDSLYKPGRDEISTDDEIDGEIFQPRNGCAKKKHGSNSNLNKMKEQIMIYLYFY
ncbi:hypothetical protein PIB30_000458 [Stylosanthes scabra]|uniref:PB1-like domain-containing protein n=1 Tax=Stylosanthes scabra TaxID=79078 RepID=A0ABU6V187_9FABA|nr:hypothetical protein [Stylosanthes scabra]